MKANNKKRKQNLQTDNNDDQQLFSEKKGIVSSALYHTREKPQNDDVINADYTISSVAAEIRAIFEELKKNIEKDRKTFAEVLLKYSQECENALKQETDRFQAVYEKFRKEKSAHVQKLKDIIAKYEGDKEKLFTQYEQQRKKERNLIQEKEKECHDKIISLEESLMTNKPDDKAFSLLRKTLGSILETASDEDVSADE